MRIKRIDISGFKSFCDNTRVQFGQPVTAVVGPNGCGKSNILDSIRWALGEQSAKNLRGRAMGDVIFNGSESRGPQSLAEVTITFDNTDGLSHPSYVEYSEIAVTRRLHRDEHNTSEYLINKIPCRLMDITDLFLGTGGGARAYSIIEQGRIGVIVSARSEDRRLMIEEAAGITKYKSARRAAERRMDKTRQNLLRVTDIVAEMERNLASLNRQAKKAERYKRYRNEQTDLELYVATHRYLELRAETMVITEKLQAKERGLDEARTELDSMETKVAQLRLGEQEAKSRLDDATAESYELNQEIQVLENEVRHLKEAIGRHQIESERADDQEATSRKQLAELDEESQLLREQMTRLEQERAATATKYQEISGKADKARARLEMLSEENDVRREGISRARARLAAAESAVENLGRRNEEAEERLKSIRTECSGLENRASELRNQATSLQKRTAAVEDLLETARSTEEEEREIYDRLRREVEECDEERRRVRDELKIKASRKTSLEEVMSGLESHDRAVREAVTLLRSEGQGLLDGLVIDYIECPEQYEQALAAALGDRLQALAVRNRESGLELLEMLKTRNMGRVTVLATDTLEGEPEPSVHVSSEQVRGPLTSFLKVKPAAEALFTSILADVYVVDSLEAAEQLWRAHEGQAAFVTLDGQLLEADGAMRGGRSSSPGADLLSQKRQVRELKSEVANLSEIHDQLEMKFSALKEELYSHRDAGEQAREEAQSQEIALAEVRKDNSRATADLQGIEKRFETMSREIAQQEEMLAQSQKDRELSENEAEDARQEIDQLERSLSEQTARIESCREEADKLALDTSDLRVLQASLDQQWQNSVDREEQIGRSKREIDENMARLDELKTRALHDLGRAAGEAVKQKEVLVLRLEGAELLKDRIVRARDDLSGAAARVLEAEDDVKSRRKAVDGLTGRISELKLESREASLAVEHLLDTVKERNDCVLTRMVGDYHLRPLPDEETLARIDELKRLIHRMGAINLAAIDEFESESKRHEDLVVQKDDLEQALEDLELAISKMDKDSRRRFKETFDDVNRRFKEIFPRLFKGGRAELLLTDPGDMLRTGVDIIAQPPGKRLRNIELMSGGEKALTAVALLFSIFLHRPSPFCILDEVDAPLDEANVDRFIDMVHEMTDRSQFIIITHSKLTMERSDALYGVTMQEPGVSKIVSVRLNADAKAETTSDHGAAAANV